jgi:protein-disulfide isomerase
MSRRASALAAALCLSAAPVLPGCEGKHDDAADTPRVKIDGQRFRVDLFDDDLSLGGDAPLVTIVVFTDYACPPCGRTWQVMDNLVEDYGQDIRVVYRSFTVPGFERGEQAAEAAYAAEGQGKFWEMHRRLFGDPSSFDRPNLLAHAEALELDIERFAEDLDTGRHAGRRIRHRRQAKQLGVLGLPAMFVNGLFVAGYHDEKVWHGIVDEEIASAKEMLAGGVLRADLYAELMSKASTGRVQQLGEAKALAKELEAKAAPPVPKDLEPPDSAQRYDVPIDGAPSIGPADALVVIVEFVDFRCPYCRRAWSEELSKVLEKHPADVRLVLKQLPLEIHPEARGVAIAALAADRQGKIEAFHDAMLRHVGEVGRSDFLAFAKAQGLDEAKFLADLDDPALATAVSDDMRLATRLGVTGTPAFFVNGRYQTGFRPGAIELMVGEELERAQAKVAEGTSRADVARAMLGPTAVGPEGFPNP